MKEKIARQNQGCTTYADLPTRYQGNRNYIYQISVIQRHLLLGFYLGRRTTCKWKSDMR